MNQRLKIHKAIPNRGPLNYSHLLDAPAGKHGFVECKNGHLYFENGKRARFIGFNLPTRSNTPNHETAEKLAERFASMGVNVIRLHAADAPIGQEAGSWSSCKEAPLLDYEAGTTRQFHKEGLDRFDYFVARLKEKGIYLHIDLNVNRHFLQGDELEYSSKMGLNFKCYSMINERMIELQKEYAKELLCHKNPYTGLALIDDPSVMTIQINNEDSVIKGTEDIKDIEDVKPYREELQRKFNFYLLMKYGTRDKLKAAWTIEGISTLEEDEDPLQGTVKIAEGYFFQPTNHPTGSWENGCSPARYSDYMEYGIYMNRKFYREMKDYIHCLGAKVPIVTSNLLGGAADVYGHIDGDLMENNTYFNHPMLPIEVDNTYLVAGPTEYVSTNPLTIQKGYGAMATTLISLAVTAVVEGKPFIISEWNEYGLFPFHSTAFVHTVAYASLNDWDGLILYAHHTSENLDDQPEDEIWNIFDAYNDPSVICQWGFMASLFLQELVTPSKKRIDIVFTKNDLNTLPSHHSMPNTFLPYITSMKNVFLDGGEKYEGDADIAVSAGFLNGVDLEEAKHAVYYSWSPYRDALRKYKDDNRLSKRTKDTEIIQAGVNRSDKKLVIENITDIAGNGDFKEFASIMDDTMKKWNIIPKDTGYVDGKLISDTGELIFDPDNSQFRIQNDYCSYFSGRPDDSIVLSDKITVKVKNNRISLSLLSEGKKLSESTQFILTALGATGVEDATYTPREFMPGVAFTAVKMSGKLYADTLEGAIFVKAKGAMLHILSPIGELLQELKGELTSEGVRIDLDGSIPGVQFVLIIEE